MRYHLYRVAAVLFSILGIYVILMLSKPQDNVQEGFRLTFKAGEETIEAYQKENKYYLFLPSYVKLDEVLLAKDSSSFQIVSNGQLITSKESLGNLPLETDISCIHNETKEAFTLTIMQSENIPAVYITTATGTMEKLLLDKEHEESGNMKVIKADGTVDCNSRLKSISGRGNYSWDNYEKKPFTVSLKEEQSILDLKAGKKWVLISNASDTTLIRNELVKGIERALEMTMQNEGTFVDLYLNGEYYGNYYLCEKIEVGASRIAITDMEEEMEKLYVKQNLENYPEYREGSLKGKELEYNPADITGGYLLEREFEDRYKIEDAENPSSFITKGKEHFIVKSPKYCSKEQIQYISQLVQEAEDAILAEDGRHQITGKSYEEYIDVESFVKKYLVEEVSKNYDGGISSAYFYKDSDAVSPLLYAGPSWDFDMSFGNYLEWMAYFSKDPEGITKLSLHDHACPWYAALLRQETYFNKVKTYYKDRVSPYLQELTEEKIDWWEEWLAASAAMDFVRWEQMYADNPYFVSREQSFEQLKDFVAKRKAFIDSVWIENHVYHTVTFSVDGVILEIRYIEDKEEIGELPVVTLGGQEYVDWQWEKTGEFLEKETIVKEDMSINGIPN